jgi:predicted amidohydrolase
MPPIKVAAVQAAPHAFDLHKSLDKLAALTADAAKQGAKLVVFPEAFLTGYPRHLGFKIGSRSEEDREWYTKYVTVSMACCTVLGRTPCSSESPLREIYALDAIVIVATRSCASPCSPLLDSALTKRVA